jgi:hypothetical protein
MNADGARPSDVLESACSHGGMETHLPHGEVGIL